MESQKKILVVDDELIIVKLLQRLLEKRNYKVLTAQNGIEALKCLNSEEIDLMIVDVMMPKTEMDGVSLLKVAKSTEKKKIPAISNNILFSNV